MYNYKKKFKTQKFKTFKQIETNYNYLFFCRYFDLKSSNLIALKNCLNKKQIQFIIIKQNLLQTDYSVKGQGSLLIIYFNEYNHLQFVYKILIANIKIEPLFLSYQKTILSILKLKKILTPFLSPLSYQLKQPLFQIYQVIARIS